MNTRTRTHSIGVLRALEWEYAAARSDYFAQKKDLHER
jgi:hypothetical protein